VRNSVLLDQGIRCERPTSGHFEIWGSNNDGIGTKGALFATRVADEDVDDAAPGGS
jgi:hypothetical protein